MAEMKKLIDLQPNTLFVSCDKLCSLVRHSVDSDNNRSWVRVIAFRHGGKWKAIEPFDDDLIETQNVRVVEEF